MLSQIILKFIIDVKLQKYLLSFFCYLDIPEKKVDIVKSKLKRRCGWFGGNGVSVVLLGNLDDTLKVGEDICLLVKQI